MRLRAAARTAATPVLAGGFNTGDTDLDGNPDVGADLDLHGELYASPRPTSTITAAATATSTTSATADSNETGPDTDDDVRRDLRSCAEHDQGRFPHHRRVGSADSAGDVITLRDHGAEHRQRDADGVTVTDPVEGGGRTAATPFRRRLQHRRAPTWTASRRRRRPGPTRRAIRSPRPTSTTTAAATATSTTSRPPTATRPVRTRTTRLRR